MPDESTVADDAPKPRRTIRAWHLLIAALAVLLGGHLLWLVIVNQSVDAELQAIREAGYPATPKEADAAYEPVPDDQNAAIVLQRAFDKIREPTSEPLKKNLPLLGEAERPATDKPLPGKMRDAIEKVLADNEAALKRLHKGAAMERSRYPVDLSQGIETLLPYLSEVRAGGILLMMEGYVRLDEGRPEAAAASAEAMLGLARSLRREPILVSLLVRRSLHKLSLDLLQRALARGDLSIERLRRLQAELAAAETPETLGRCVAANRAALSALFEEPIGKIVKMATGSGGAGRSFWDEDTMKARALRYSGLLALDRLTCIDVMSGMLRAAEKPLAQRPAAMEKAERAVHDLPFYAMVTQAFVPSLSRAAEIDVGTITRLRAAQTALAVEHHRLAHGEPPADLDALSPDFIDAVPVDPFTGNPLQYKRLDAGFTVYSVGLDKTDDGGAEPKDDGTLKPGTDIPFAIRR